MDIFIEKLVTRKKTSRDYLIRVGIILAAIILSIAALTFLGGFGPIVIAGMIYGAYLFLTGTNVEFEYSVTNGDIDIDRITAQRKRKRVFSSHCKEFDMVARASDPKHQREVQNVNIKNRIEAVSSMDSPDVYFITLNYKGNRTIVFFEPSEKMLNAFKTFIPRKVFEA